MSDWKQGCIESPLILGRCQIQGEEEENLPSSRFLNKTCYKDDKILLLENI